MDVFANHLHAELYKEYIMRWDCAHRWRRGLLAPWLQSVALDPIESTSAQAELDLPVLTQVEDHKAKRTVKKEKEDLQRREGRMRLYTMLLSPKALMIKVATSSGFGVRLFDSLL